MSRKNIDIFNELEDSEKEQVHTLFKEYLINPKISAKILSREVGHIINRNIDRRGIIKLMDTLGYDKKDPEIVKQSKIQRSIILTQEIKEEEFNNILSRLEKDKIIELYKNGSSIAELSNKFNISFYYMKKVLQYYNVRIRDLPKTHYEIIKELDDNGYNKDTIQELYFNETLTFKKFKATLEKVINYKIADTTCRRLLTELDIIKLIDLVPRQQGTKSRKELIRNLEKLNQAGFNNREELAKYYESNKNITKYSLVKQLNNNLGEEYFTPRWLGRHLDPFLSEDRLRGVSRAELHFQESLTNAINIPMEFNNWTIIKPYQLDIIIPNEKIAIEFNGNYWHSDKFMLKNHNLTAKEYHNMKYLMAKEQGYELLFVWEYDWYEEPENIINAIKQFIKKDIKDPILNKLEYV